MKRLIPLCLSLMIFTQTTAFAEDKVMYSCEDIYKLQLSNKLEKRDKYNDRWNKSRGDTSLNGGLTIAGAIVGLGTGSVPILLVAALTPTVISTIKNIPSREEKVQKLQDETSASFNRYIKRLQKDVSPDVSPEEVSEVIQAGFDSGLYCENLPKLLSPNAIRKQVKGLMVAKYGKVEKK